MAQYIKNANIFGRVGSGIGQGLAEQLPKELEHARRKADLEAFSNDAGNLSPMQQVARASSIYGVTPQMIQSLSEQAKIQNQSNAFRNLAQQENQQNAESEAQSLAKADQRKILQNAVNQKFVPGQLPQAQQGEQVNAPYQSPAQRIENLGKGEREGGVNQNPLSSGKVPLPPATEQEIAQRATKFLKAGYQPSEAYRAAESELAKERALPEVERAQFDQNQEGIVKAREELKRQTEQRLQKEGKDIYGDITGDMYEDVEQKMADYLESHPNESYRKVARDYSKRILSLAKTKKDYEKFSAGLGGEKWLKGSETLEKLKSYQNSFSELDNEEEYYNLLRRTGETTAEGKTKPGMGLSDQGAASVAFPMKADAQKFVDGYKPNSYFPLNQKFGSWRENARKASIDVAPKLSDKDSLLSIARALSAKDPSFDQAAFFEQLRKDRDKIRLNERQRRELDSGVRDLLPTWGDISVFPKMGRG